MYTTTLMDEELPSGLHQQIWIMFIVFCVSLFAVSFPSLSERNSFLSIPRIVFFVGKHFGTGVILSTAFVHLLQDAFRVLNREDVRQISEVGEWAGLIVLGSILAIFCIEYISVSYASRLDLDNLYHDHNDSHNADLEVTNTSFAPHNKHNTNERAPLLQNGSRPVMRHQSLPIFEGHHRFERHDTHSSHRRLSRLSHWFFSPEVDHQSDGSPYVGDPDMDRTQWAATTVDVEEQLVVNGSRSRSEEPSTPGEDSVTSEKRQVVGILVLQLGIMIHSFVIGVALSVSEGSEFTSLVTAITFHQLFEGLSLGTRIATLPVSTRSLPSILTVAFAITVPIGITTGLYTLKGTNELAKMHLIQGIMAAVSAGMLIYAACVEMIAGDFVMDPMLWQSSIRKQTLAVGSLIVGAGAMASLAAFD